MWGGMVGALGFCYALRMHCYYALLSPVLVFYTVQKLEGSLARD